MKTSTKNGIEYYHFPSCSLDKTVGYHDIEGADKTKKITDGEHSEVQKGMQEFQVAMSKQLDGGAVTQHLTDEAGLSDGSTSDDGVDLVKLRDNLKLDACSGEHQLKKASKTIARVSVDVPEAKMSDALAAQLASHAERVQEAQILIANMQFAGEHGTCRSTAAIATEWRVDATKLRTNIDEGLKMIGALVPKKTAPSPKKAGKRQTKSNK